MRQYSAAKQQNPDALLFFRMGDFYELFYEDAKVAARELEITLTARDRERQIPMCGVPYHAAEAYLGRLLRKGYRVALCEQMEDPRLTKRIVRREVTRVLTPGTAIDPELAAERGNYLACIHATENVAALAVLDVSTGDFSATEMRGPDALQQCLAEIEKLQPAELLYAGESPLAPEYESGVPQPTDPGSPARGLGALGWGGRVGSFTKLEGVRTRTPLDPWIFTADYALPLLQRQLSAHSLEGFGLAGHTAAGIAAGAVVHYVRQTQQTDLSHIDSLSFYARSSCLELDLVTVRNLELVEPLFADSAHDAGRDATLFRALDCCVTPMGKRLLRASILRPFLDAGEITSRLEAVAFVKSRLIEREELRRLLGSVYDLERMLARLSLDSAGPRDVATLGASIECLPLLRAALSAFPQGRWSRLLEALDPLEDLHARIVKTIAPQPPVTLNDGGVIAPGCHAELDELRGLSHTGRQSVAAIEERERQRTGIASLKVKFNSVFGYYIEITRSNLKAVPADYERKQTLVNAERFTTPELKDYETRILTAHERAIEIERAIFAELRQTIIAASSRIRRTASALAEIDLLASFAHLAALRNYTQPVLVEGGLLEAVAARHPVVETRLENSGEGRFVPNDLHVAVDGPALLVITGPNMGGKSTYLRQAALLVILAQMGSFVPADSMRWSIVDRVFTRIGASDNVARGRSTFMVEMMETATILNTATERSLVLLDEMGRGTATFDGLSLAWATLEFLHARIGARTLFATHYHELTMLADSLPRLKNLRVAVKETGGGISFLHAIEPGAANRSYGIDVAKLAGLPASVIARAKAVLKQHEQSEKRTVAVETDAPLQMMMFTPLSQRILERLEETDVDTLTPLQALNLIEALKNEIKGQTKA